MKADRTDGYTDAVVLSPEAYDDLAEKAELVKILATIESSMGEIGEGRTQPAKPAMQRIAGSWG